MKRKLAVTLGLMGISISAKPLYQ